MAELLNISLKTQNEMRGKKFLDSILTSSFSGTNLDKSPQRMPNPMPIMTDNGPWMILKTKESKKMEKLIKIK